MIDNNRDLLYLRIESEAIKRDQEFGPAQTYDAELARVAAIVNELAEARRPNPNGSSYGD